MTKTRTLHGGILLFGLFFAGLGSFFCYLVLCELRDIRETHRWPAVPAKLEAVEVEFPTVAPATRDSDVFQLAAHYHYEFQGQHYAGHQIGRKSVRSSQYEELALRKHAMMRNENLAAYVSPQDPTVAVLERDSLWFGLILLLPLTFVLLGVILVLGSLRLLPENLLARHKKKRSRRAALCGKFPSRGANTVPFTVGALFFLAGIGASLPLFLLPMTARYRSKSWMETPCEVVWSRVRTHPGDDGDTYSIDVFYRYVVDGQQHFSNRYSFVTGSSSGRKGKAGIVAKYPAGANATCFVHPLRPERAVLTRDLRSLGFWWLFPLPFLGIGIAILFGSIRSCFRSK